MCVSLATQKEKLVWKKKCAVMAAVLFSAFVSTAHAVSTFDPDTGVGTIEEGDLRLAFGWENADQTKRNAPNVIFTFVQRETFVVICTWSATKGQQAYNIVRTLTRGVDSNVFSVVHLHSPPLEFRLTGLTNFVYWSGSVPVVGGACPQSQHTDGVWSTVTQTGRTLQLDARFAGITVNVWP